MNHGREQMKIDIFSPAYDGALAYLQKQVHADEGSEPEVEVMLAAAGMAIAYMIESRDNDIWLSSALHKFGINISPADIGDFVISICAHLQD